MNPQAIADGRKLTARRPRKGGIVAIPAPPNKHLYALRARDVWRFMKQQRASYWLVCFYLFLEYVRPHNVFESLSVYPFTFWTILLCLGAYMLEGLKLRPWTLIDTLLAIFTFILLASTVTAYSPSYSLGKLNEYYTWVIIYAMITLIVVNEDRFLVFMMLYLFYCLKMSQFGARKMLLSGFAWEAWGTSCAPAFFQNSGECGIQMSMYFPTAWFFIVPLMKYWGKYKRWLFYFMPVSTIMMIVATSSRGALLAIGAVAAWMIAQSRHRVRGLVFLGAASAVVWFAMVPQQSKDRFYNMGEDSSSTKRLWHWHTGLQDMRDYPVLGIGYANWQPYHRGQQLPHNIFIQAGSELGILGLAAFIALILGTFALNLKTRRAARRLSDGAFLANMSKALDGALVGFLVGGYFVTVLYYPFFWINLSMTVALYTSTMSELKRENMMHSRVHPGRFAVPRTGPTRGRGYG